ncbi:MAG: PBS lyase [Desulfofustis sp.]|nr:PBS lyase [Desulfofustis sp.]
MKTKKLQLRRPWCPFCGIEVNRPTDIPDRHMNEFSVGQCSCGAVYSSDPTGHNVGAALVETLIHACGGNSDLAWELLPEDDYLTGRVEPYDEITHRVVETRSLDGRSIRGVLYFVRLHAEISDIAGRLKRKKEQDVEQVNAYSGFVPPPVEPVGADRSARQKATKRQVKKLIADGDEDGLVGLCLDDRKTLRLAQRLLYDPVEENRWRTAWLLGKVCARVATRDPGQVSELVHRLFEACSDSAASPWGMIETIGAVVSARPDIFGAFTPYLLNYAAADSTRVQTIWALAEIAKNRPDLVRKTPFFSMFHFLNHPRPEVRGQLARLLGRLNATEAVIQLMGLHEDTAELVIWEEGAPVQTSVAEQAQKALNSIQKPTL